MSEQALVIPASAPAAMVVHRQAADEYARASKAKNTVRAYKVACEYFEAWCQAHGVRALPAEPETIRLYLAALARGSAEAPGLKHSTLSIKRSAIRWMHLAANLPDPTQSEIITAELAGIARIHGRQSTPKAPLTADLLRPIVDGLDTNTLAGLRDRALLLLGYAGAFRRGELLALDVGDVELLPHEARVTVRRSKTDQEGRGLVKHLPAVGGPYCPAGALREYIAAARLTAGPLFRRLSRWGTPTKGRLGVDSLVHIVKREAARLGLDKNRYSGHSLRRGFVTSAASAGVDAMDIAAQTGHKSLDMVRRYIDDAGRGARRATRAALTYTPGAEADSQ